MDKNVHARHRQRLKERFLKDGFDSFSPHEILEFLLFYALPRKDTNAIGHQLVKKFGSLSRVFEAPIEELEKIEGISTHSAILIKMIPIISREYMKDKMDIGTSAAGYKEMGEYFASRFIGVVSEQVVVALLDNSKRVIDIVTLHEGSVSSSAVDVRKIAQLALMKNAPSIILAHNHPGGAALPSPDDIMTTRAISKALELLDIELLEHYVVADEKYIGVRHMLDNTQES